MSEGPVTDTGNPAASAVLVTGPDAPRRPDSALMTRVARESGLSPLRQMAQIMALRMGRQKMSATEYYDLRLFDPALDRSARRSFLGQGGINALNRRINPDSLEETKAQVGNKLVFGARLKEAGLPVTETQAFVSSRFGAGDDFLLDSPEALAGFLRGPARYPLFGKPLGGSLSVGAVRIEGIAGESLRLGGGREVPLTDFAAEVFGQFDTDGYLLQTALAPHSALAEITGQAVGAVRLVTAHDGIDAWPLYALWKIPGPGAASDNFWQAGSMLALLDLSSGRITRCQRGLGLEGHQPDHHPESGVPLLGRQLPHWTALVELGCTTHALFPELGLCGFDIALTEAGPVMIECNDQPNHMLYQYATGEGLRGGPLEAAWWRLIKRRRRGR